MYFIYPVIYLPHLTLKRNLRILKKYDIIQLKQERFNEVMGTRVMNVEP